MYLQTTKVHEIFDFDKFNQIGTINKNLILLTF